MQQTTHTDANEIAGLFEEIFGRDVTAAQRVCRHCGQRSQIGAHTLFRGAGMVIRCPACGHTAAVIVALEDRYAVSLHGVWMLA